MRIFFVPDNVRSIIAGDNKIVDFTAQAAEVFHKVTRPFILAQPECRIDFP